jgi:hypothetical protein
MGKYPKQLVEDAKRRIREHLSEGLTYHQAAKRAAEEFPINFLSLRYHAYKISLEMSLDSGGIQHPPWTEHGQLLETARKRLLSQGYEVLEEQNEIRKRMLAYGVRGNPDLYATKGQETILVEVYVDDKKLIDQLNRYSRVGKVVLMLPVEAENIEVWGSPAGGSSEVKKAEGR